MIRREICEKVKALKPIAGTASENKRYSSARAFLSTRLLNIFESFEPHLPKGKNLKVLSLGCGIPDEYIALRTFYDARGIKIDYTGIDVLQDQNVKINESFFPLSADSFRLLTCDGSSIPALKSTLAEAKCLPEKGFDLVVLRQPDVLTIPRCKIFIKMIQEVIPFFSSTTSRTFISCYHLAEVQKVNKLTEETGVYFKPGSSNFIQLSSESGKVLIEGVSLTLDNYSMTFVCHGLALTNGKGLAVEFKGSHPSEYVHVTYPKTADDYVSRLQSIIGKDSQGGQLLIKDAKHSQVSLPRFWLRQLAPPAIDELSRELSCGKSTLR